MADFGPVINYYLSGRRPNFAPLVELKLRDGAKRFWDGGYDLPTAGKVWQNAKGALVNIDGIGIRRDISADYLTFTFSMAKESGLGAEMWSMAHSADVAQYRRRPAIVYLAFFDSDWQLLAEPYAFKAGMMMAMPFDDQRDGGGRLQQVHLKCVNIFCWRSGTHTDPYYSDRAQQMRFPGDRGLQFIQSLQRVLYRSPWR